MLPRRLTSFYKSLLDASDVLTKTACTLPQSALSIGMVDQTQRRRYTRARPARNLLVAWQAGTRRGVSYLESLAMGGLFVLTRQPLPIRSTIKVLLDLSAGEVRARAIVRRITPTKGMGVEFIAMSPEDRARLNRAMMLMLAEQ